MASASPLSTPQEKALRRKLCLMMFLQFFIWGAWFELGFDYIPKLGFSGWQNAMIFGAFNIGALVALFFSTQFADRKFAAEKFVAFSHLIGGLAILGLFFLPLKAGTGVGEVASVRIDGPGPALTSGVGELPDKTRVVVENLVAANDNDDPKVADSPAAKEKLKTYLAAKPDERDAKKLGEGLGNATMFWAVFEQSLKEYERTEGSAEKEAGRMRFPHHVRGLEAKPGLLVATRRRLWPRSGRSSCSCFFTPSSTSRPSRSPTQSPSPT